MCIWIVYFPVIHPNPLYFLFFSFFINIYDCMERQDDTNEFIVRCRLWIVKSCVYWIQSYRLFIRSSGVFFLFYVLFCFKLKSADFVILFLPILFIFLFCFFHHFSRILFYICDFWVNIDRNVCTTYVFFIIFA